MFLAGRGTASVREPRGSGTFAVGSRYQKIEEDAGTEKTNCALL
jgi:hypothetical protein